MVNSCNSRPRRNPDPELGRAWSLCDATEGDSDSVSDQSKSTRRALSYESDDLWWQRRFLRAVALAVSKFELNLVRENRDGVGGSGGTGGGGSGPDGPSPSSGRRVASFFRLQLPGSPSFAKRATITVTARIKMFLFLEHFFRLLRHFEGNIESQSDTQHT